MKYPVVIIGAGPAGSSAALALSKKGVSCVLIDKKRIVGVPVQCAEFVSAAINSYVDVSSFPSAISQGVKFMDVDTGRNYYRFEGAGYVLNRDVFDFHMAGMAAESGAKLLAGTRVFKINGHKNSVEALDTGEKLSFEIYYDYLIVAAGPGNLPGVPKNGPYIYAVQAKNVLLGKLESAICFFRPYIPYGYGWVFPKGEFANVGIGIEKPAASGTSLTVALDAFLKEMSGTGLINAAVVEKTSGLVPVSGLKEAASGNIALCGDAAGLTHPVTGAGIMSAVISGSLLGGYAAESVTSSRNLLADYREELESIFKKPLEAAAGKRRELYPLMTDVSSIDRHIKYLWPSFEEYYGGRPR